jgi:hypothetical protein
MEGFIGSNPFEKSIANARGGAQALLAIRREAGAAFFAELIL